MQPPYKIGDKVTFDKASPLGKGGVSHETDIISDVFYNEKMDSWSFRLQNTNYWVPEKDIYYCTETV